MVTIVIADNHILVDDKLYVPLDWVAYVENGQIGIHHVNNFDQHLFKGRVDPSEISLNGTTYATAVEFVYAFNAITIAALSYLLTSMKANTDYPQNFFSQNSIPSAVTAETIVPIPAAGKGGYVVLTTPAANVGNIYVGESDVSAISYRLAPDKSITLELADISQIYVLAATAGDTLDVVGGYKN